MIGMYGPLSVYKAAATKHGSENTVFVRACNMVAAIRLFDRFGFPPADEPKAVEAADPESKNIAPFVAEDSLVAVNDRHEVWSYSFKNGLMTVEQLGTQEDPTALVQCSERGPGIELVRNVRKQAKRRRTVVGRARYMAMLLGEQYSKLDRDRQHRWEFLAYCYSVEPRSRRSDDPILQAIQLSKIDNPEAAKDPTIASRLFLDLPKERQLQFLEASEKLRKEVR